MIRLLRKELFYDIEQQTQRIGEARVPADNPELLDRVQLNTLTATDRDLLIRWIESGVSLLHIWMRNKLVNPDTSKGWWTGWGEYDSNRVDAPELVDDGDIVVVRPGDEEPSDSGEEVVHDDALNQTVTEYDFSFGCNVDEKAMAMLFHRFIVRYALWQWADMFAFTDLGRGYKEQCKELKDEIDDNLNDVSLPRKWHDPHTPHLQVDHPHERFEV